MSIKNFFSGKTGNKVTDSPDYLKEQQAVSVERGQLLESLQLKSAARYRCTQNNIIKVLDNVTFSADIKTQYLLSTSNGQSGYFHVELEDYIYSLNPNAMEIAFQLVEPIEYIRNDIIFTQNDKAEITNIVNMPLLKRAWENFKYNKLTDLEFYKKLRKQNSKATDDILATGDIEFSDMNSLSTTLDKNLFYHILLKANVANNLSNFRLSQLSQLFPNQKLITDVKANIISDNDISTVFGLAGTLNRENLSDEQLTEQYNEIYKPMIKYSFTEFDYLYRITYTVHKKTGLLVDANVLINEKIKNNYESITQFQIKKVEL